MLSVILFRDCWFEKLANAIVFLSFRFRRLKILLKAVPPGNITRNNFVFGQ